MTLAKLVVVRESKKRISLFEWIIKVFKKKRDFIRYDKNYLQISIINHLWLIISDNSPFFEENYTISKASTTRKMWGLFF